MTILDTTTAKTTTQKKLSNHPGSSMIGDFSQIRNYGRGTNLNRKVKFVSYNLSASITDFQLFGYIDNSFLIQIRAYDKKVAERIVHFMRMVGVPFDEFQPTSPTLSFSTSDPKVMGYAIKTISTLEPSFINIQEDAQACLNISLENNYHPPCWIQKGDYNRPLNYGHGTLLRSAESYVNCHPYALIRKISVCRYDDSTAIFTELHKNTTSEWVKENILNKIPGASYDKTLHRIYFNSNKIKDIGHFLQNIAYAVPNFSPILPALFKKLNLELAVTERKTKKFIKLKAAGKFASVPVTDNRVDIESLCRAFSQIGLVPQQRPKADSIAITDLTNMISKMHLTKPSIKNSKNRFCMGAMVNTLHNLVEELDEAAGVAAEGIVDTMVDAADEIGSFIEESIKHLTGNCLSGRHKKSTEQHAAPSSKFSEQCAPSAPSKPKYTPS